MEENEEAYENLEDIASEMDSENPTVRDVVRELIERAKNEKVYAFNDDPIGLESDLSEDLLSKTIDDIDNKTSDKHQDEIEKIIDAANSIYYYETRTLSEDDLEEIKEDNARLGLK